MIQKDAVLIASRALALYLVFWGVGNLAGVPSLMFSAAHYAAQPGSGANYLYKSDIISLTSHVVFSGSLFLASTWCYRCVPRIQAFLSPSEREPEAPES